MGVLGVFRDGCLGEFAVILLRGSYRSAGDAQDETRTSSLDLGLASPLLPDAVLAILVEPVLERLLWGCPLAVVLGLLILAGLSCVCQCSSDDVSSDDLKVSILSRLTSVCKAGFLVALPLVVRRGAASAIISDVKLVIWAYRRTHPQSFLYALHSHVPSVSSGRFAESLATLR